MSFAVFMELLEVVSCFSEKVIQYSTASYFAWERSFGSSQDIRLLVFLIDHQEWAESCSKLRWQLVVSLAPAPAS